MALLLGSAISKKNYRYVKGKKLLKNIIEKPPERSHPQIKETISS